MAEYIEREDLIKKVSSVSVQMLGLRAGKSLLREAMKIYKETFIKCVEEAPSADVVEVVRCKDCVYKKEELNINDDLELMCGFNYGLRVRGAVLFDDFCSYGKRKEGAKNDL